MLFYSTFLSPLSHVYLFLSFGLIFSHHSQSLFLSHSHSQPLLSSFLTHSQPLLLSLDIDQWVMARWISELLQGGSVVVNPSHWVDKMHKPSQNLFISANFLWRLVSYWWQGLDCEWWLWVSYGGFANGYGSSMVVVDLCVCLIAYVWRLRLWWLWHLCLCLMFDLWVVFCDFIILMGW